jgi:peptidoglycan/LPS O-acetylase OafA/YrhL
MALCIPFAIAWMPTDKLKEFSESVVAVSIFSSNFLFWMQSGYFELASDEKPLIHTWSLAVEEQYYLFFPLLLMLFWKSSRKIVLPTLIVCIGVCSFFIAEWGSRTHPSANFYLIPSRAWELFLGSVIALRLRGESPKSGSLNNALAFGGIFLIALSIFSFDQSTPFPGVFAMVPTVGTALVILYATDGTLVNKYLSKRGFVQIGLISYSAYLWHQPLFAFARIRSLNEPHLSSFLVLGIASLGLAHFSWRYVEAPFRNRRYLSQSTVFITAGLTSVAIASIGAFTAVNAGKISEPYLSVPLAKSTKECRNLSVLEFPVDCVLGKYRGEGSRPEVILWGDSYADALTAALDEELSRQNKMGIALIKHNCPSIVGVSRNEPIRLGTDFSEKCRTYSENSQNAIVESSAETVIMTSSYRRYFNDSNLEGQSMLLSDVDSSDYDQDNRTALIKHLVLTIESIVNSGKKVILILPHPYQEKESFIRELKRLHFDGAKESTFSLDHMESVETANAIQSQIERRFSADKVHVFAPDQFLCSKRTNECRAMDEGRNLLLSDGSHFSLKGAKRVIASIQTEFE